MKVLALIVALGFFGAAGASAEQGADAEVREVVQRAYVDGIHNFRRVDDVRAGFHPGFEMLVLRDGELERVTIAAWIERLEEQNARNPVPPDAPASFAARYPSIDITGDCAVVKVELFREGEQLFTDYLSLYRFSEGWRIVGKVFHRH